MEGKIKKWVSRVQLCEGVIHNWEKAIARIRGGAEERRVRAEEIRVRAEERQRKEGEGSKELYSTVSVDAHSCNHSYL